jgi:nitrogenase molybdenum-iron protein alpha/beta subunit
MEERRVAMKRTLPDGFVGAVMAVESISDVVAFLHGPGGCRVRFMVHSGAVFPRVKLDDNDSFYIPYFCGYPRVPATYLDEYDYINGAYYKLEEGLPIVGAREPGLIVIINSPGAGLIGDNHERAIREAGLEDRAIFMDESLVSIPMTQGYDHTLLEIMKYLGPKKERTDKDTVNIIGLTIMDKDFKAALEEITENLESMGLKVRCAPGAGADLSDLRDSVNSEYCVVVCPEACQDLMEFYRSAGLKIIRSEAGAPVGFDAIESFYKTIAEATGTDASVPLSKVAKAKDKIYQKFVGMRYNALRIKGLKFSAAGIASVIRPLTEWMYSYLATAPIAVDVDPGSDPSETEKLREFLESVDYGQSFGVEPKSGSDIVLCEGITAITMRLNGECSIGIPIGHSTMGLDDVIPRPIYGTQGVLYVLDEILHGVRNS